MTLRNCLLGVLTARPFTFTAQNLRRKESSDMNHAKAVLVLTLVVSPVVFASNPTSGSLDSLGQTVIWTGSIPAGADTSGAGGCNFSPPGNNCDHFFLTVNAPLSGATQVIQVRVADFGENDLDLVV